MLRSGLIDAARYLKLLGETITACWPTPGRAVQSVAQSSFDAWVKYYRGDENTPNATISYYAKGSLVALALDLTLRSEGRGTLDDVMRACGRAAPAGRSTRPTSPPRSRRSAAARTRRELAAWVHGTDELPLARPAAALRRRAGARSRRRWRSAWACASAKAR